jgi:hypothetical protein
LNSDGSLESFRLCTSNEGLHLTVWAGEPLKSKRLWHEYYYLGFDVEQTAPKKIMPNEGPTTCGSCDLSRWAIWFGKGIQ